MNDFGQRVTASLGRIVEYLSIEIVDGKDQVTAPEFLLAL
jgi:hypothetical protein